MATMLDAAPDLAHALALFVPRVGVARRKVDMLLAEGGQLIEVLPTMVRLRKGGMVANISDWGKVEWT